MFKSNAPNLLIFFAVMLSLQAKVVLAEEGAEGFNTAANQQILINSGQLERINQYLKQQQGKRGSAGTARTKSRIEPLKTEIHPAYNVKSLNMPEAIEQASQDKFDPRLIADNDTEIRGFFKKGDVTDFFYKEDISLQPQPQVKILNSKAKRLEEDSEEPAKQPAGKELPDESSPKSPEDIVSRFGDPVKEPEIIPEEKAPPSYKGLMAALEIGDDELAYKYAKQFTRYQRNLSERVKKITDFSTYAMQEDGLVVKPKPSEDPQYESIAKIARRVKEQELQDGVVDITANNPLSRSALETSQAVGGFELSDAAKDLIKLAEIDEDKRLMLTAKDEEEQQTRAGLKRLDLETEKAAIRNDIKKGVPVDPNGKVLVYFFFRPADASAAEMQEAVANLFAYRSADPNFNLVSFTLDSASKEDLTAIANMRQLPFALRNGADLAEKLGVKKSPSTVFIAASTGKAFIVEGVKTAIYLDGIVSHIKGEGQK